MKMFALAASIAMTAIASAQPTALEGAQFTIEITDTGRHVPFTLTAVPGTSETRNLVAHDAATGASIPLAWSRYYLTGVLPPSLPAGKHTFTVRTSDTPVTSNVKVEYRPEESAFDVFIGPDLVTTFHRDDKDRKPYLWPLKGEGGASLTRDYPFAEGGKTKDHPHHVSFWTAHGDINGADYWEYGDRTGWQSPDSVQHGVLGALGRIASQEVWQDKDRKPVVAVERVYLFYDTPASGRLLDVNVKFTAAHGDVTFGDTKEGGIVGLRMNDDLREQGGTGKITTSEGAVGEKAAWGKPAAWCDYTGTLEGFGARGITVMNHPSSFRYPIRWHVRAYGLLGANAFGYSDFTGGKENGEYTLKNGESIEFKFRIYLHSGDVEAADVAGYFKDYANPPVAEWVE